MPYATQQLDLEESAIPSPSRGAVCYVVPYFSPADSSHFAHLPRFLNEVGKRCDLHVVIERGDALPDIPSARSIYLQREGSRLARIRELWRHARSLQRSGCHTFFVRISATAALTLNALARVSEAKVYYWVSGQGRNLRPSWRQPRRRLSCALSDRVARLNVRLSHRLVTGPETMVRYYAEEYGVPTSRIALLYNDVEPRSGDVSRDEARSRLGFGPAEKIVLFVGRVSPLKGGHHLVPLARALAARDASVRLVVVGGIDSVRDPSTEAAAIGLHNVDVRGAVPNRDLKWFYGAADVFVLPSESEGFPRVVLEAMGHRLPIVAFDVGGVRDVVDEGRAGIVVPRRDVSAMADGVMRLLASPALRSQQVRVASDRLHRYSTEAVASMFVDAVVRPSCAPH